MQQVYYDTGDAVVEFGHNPRPQIMIVKKARQTAQKYLKTFKIVLQVCHDTGLGSDSGQVGAVSMFSMPWKCHHHWAGGRDWGMQGESSSIKRGLRDRNSPMCTLSQNGYSTCTLEELLN